jgi:hypothetical protein
MKKLINRVDDAFNYFYEAGMLEQMRSDDKYYVEALLNYVEELEGKLANQNKKK